MKRASRAKEFATPGHLGRIKVPVGRVVELADTLTPDLLRHTAISQYFRQTGSYAQAAEQFGNSENITRKHYQARVSAADTKAFYALQPAKKGTGKWSNCR